MKMTYIIHIAAGSVALIAGYIALYVSKGAPLHRRSGMVFVYAMLTMGVFGALMAAVRGVAPAINIPAALLTAYLVMTALMTVRPIAPEKRWLPVGLMVVALATGLVDVSFAMQAFANGGTRAQDGMPAFPFIMFAAVGLIGSAGDYRLLRSPVPLKGAPRLARHLWRMCFALFIAALSFFIGQAKVIPEPYRHRGLLALPVLLVLVTMFYWLWRVRVRKSLRGMVLGRNAQVA